MRLVHAVLGMVDEFLPTIAKDAQYEDRMAGLRQMRSGLSQVYLGVAMSLGETKVYAPKDLSRMLAAMAETLPRAWVHLTPDMRTELRVKLQAVRPGFQDEDLRRIDAMIAELRKERGAGEPRRRKRKRGGEPRRPTAHHSPGSGADTRI